MGLLARFDPNCPVIECVVIEQDPAAGEKMRIGGEVKLTLGARVPDLKHQRKGDVIKQLKGAGLRSRITGQCATEHCRVVTQDRAPGELVALDVEVTIEIRDRVQVPDVEGDREADAVKALKDRGLTQVQPEQSECQSGTGCSVAKQHPTADTWIDPKTIVMLTLIPAATEAAP